MEQCFRIAVWMFVLVGHLHAVPITKIRTKNIKFSLLRNLSCNETARFSSPTDVTGDCYTAGLEVFMRGMELAKDNCTDDANRIDQAVEVMSRVLATTSSENCHFTMTVHEQFESFVNAMHSFIQKSNNQ